MATPSTNPQSLASAASSPALGGVSSAAHALTPEHYTKTVNEAKGFLDSLVGNITKLEAELADLTEQSKAAGLDKRVEEKIASSHATTSQSLLELKERFRGHYEQTIASLGKLHTDVTASGHTIEAVDLAKQMKETHGTTFDALLNFKNTIREQAQEAVAGRFQNIGNAANAPKKPALGIVKWVESVYERGKINLTDRPQGELMIRHSACYLCAAMGFSAFVGYVYNATHQPRNEEEKYQQEQSKKYLMISGIASLGGILAAALAGGGKRSGLGM